MSHTSFLDTAFDEVAQPLELPIKLTDGRVPALKIGDYLARGSRTIGRLTGAASIVALKIRADHRPLRVSMQVRLDWLAVRWWVDRADAAAPPRELPRLVVVRSQGRVREAVVLARSHTSLGSSDARGFVTFDLAAGEVPEDGLLVIELADGGHTLPAWAASSFIAESPIGLQVDWIEVTPVTDGASPAPADGASPAPADGGSPATAARVRSNGAWPGRADGATCQSLGVVSAGGLIRGAGSDQGPPRTGCLVVSPRTNGGEVRLRLRAGRTFSRVGPGLPMQNRWRRSLPGRAVAKGRRMGYAMVENTLARLGFGRLRGWPVGVANLDVQAVSLADGSPLAVHAVPGRFGRLQLVVDAPREAPILIGLDPRPRRRARYRGAVVCKLLGADLA